MAATTTPTRAPRWTTGPTTATAAADPTIDDVLGDLRRVLGLQAELGDAGAPATTEVSDDPVLATYHAAALAPLGPDDHYRLLGGAGPAERRRTAGRVCSADAEEVLRFRLRA